MARDVIYRYDGSFDGLLCCVFASYEKKEVPSAVFAPDADQLLLLPEREIATDPEKAARVLRSIPQRLGPEAHRFIRRAFLTCLEQKELFLLRFLRMGYRLGPGVMDLLADETVGTLRKAVGALENESHLLMGFLRFSEFGGALAAEIEPKNFVLPLLAPHFCARLPGERFLIYDRTHGMALLHRPGKVAVLPADSLELPEPDETERGMRALWRLYYKTAEVEGRHNPRCRMSHMPKRYWSCMTEFCEPEERKKTAPGPAAGRGGAELVPIRDGR